MKNRTTWAATLGTIGLAAVVTAAMTGASAMDKFDQKLEAAQGLDVQFTVRELGGAPANYHVTLAKPNKARVETPEKSVVADGQTITTYLKKDKVYYKHTQTDSALLAVFDEQGLSVWSGFFDAKAKARHADAKSAGTINLGGTNFDVVKLSDKTGETVTTFYIDKSDSIAKKVDFQSKVMGKDANTLLNTSMVALKAGDVFAFDAPDGSKEVAEADLTAGHWLYDWDQAMTAAKATGKLVMVDFMASWCGPCKMLEKESFHTSAFKEEAKDFILLKIDIDQMPGLAQRYGVEAIPNVQFLDSNGKVVHKWLGYIPLKEVLGHMRTAKSARP